MAGEVQDMKAIHAIFEDGVFRPIDAVELPDRCHVEFEPRIIEAKSSMPDLDSVYAILNKRFESGEADVAARHNEHQP
jgi:predicted DNA-binding antitoxin AbrB/MazE fold protein